MRKVYLRNMRDLDRITKWLNLDHDFKGYFKSLDGRYKGYKANGRKKGCAGFGMREYAIMVFT